VDHTPKERLSSSSQERKDEESKGREEEREEDGRGGEGASGRGETVTRALGRDLVFEFGITTATKSGRVLDDLADIVEHAVFGLLQFVARREAFVRGLDLAQALDQCDVAPAGVAVARLADASVMGPTACIASVAARLSFV